MSPFRYCGFCQQNRLHVEGLCHRCGHDAQTHPAAWRDDITLNEGKGVQASRKRGQANARRLSG